MYFIIKCACVCGSYLLFYAPTRRSTQPRLKTFAKSKKRLQQTAGVATSVPPPPPRESQQPCMYNETSVFRARQPAGQPINQPPDGARLPSTYGGSEDSRAVQVVPLLCERYRERRRLAPAVQPAYELVWLEVGAGDVPEGPRASPAVPLSLLLFGGGRRREREKEIRKS